MSRRSIAKSGSKRAHGQDFHDRYILHYRPGKLLAEPWEDFVAELQGKTYASFIRRLFGLQATKPLILTMEWYFAWRGCSVSPHCDARRKLGTHIFYFNTEADWASDWGGHILIMDDGERLSPHSAPGFDDLQVASSLDPRGTGACCSGGRAFLARRAAAGVSARPVAEAFHRHHQCADGASLVASPPRQGPGRLPPGARRASTTCASDTRPMRLSRSSKGGQCPPHITTLGW